MYIDLDIIFLYIHVVHTFTLPNIMHTHAQVKSFTIKMIFLIFSF